MLELLAALSIAVLFAKILEKRNSIRLHADKQMSVAVDEMFKHWNTLIDAKTDFDDDVADETMELANFMIKCARKPGIEFVLAASLSERSTRSSDDKQVLISEMREPLENAFTSLVHAWFKYVSHKNLFTRFIIRAGVGRIAVREKEIRPFEAQMVNRVAHRKRSFYYRSLTA
jgi:hypothetical protein